MFNQNLRFSGFSEMEEDILVINEYFRRYQNVNIFKNLAMFKFTKNCQFSRLAYIFPETCTTFSMQTKSGLF